MFQTRLSYHHRAQESMVALTGAQGCQAHSGVPKNASNRSPLANDPAREAMDGNNVTKVLSCESSASPCTAVAMVIMVQVTEVPLRPP